MGQPIVGMAGSRWSRGKAAEAPAGRVVLIVGKGGARWIHHALDLEAAAWRKQGEEEGSVLLAGSTRQFHRRKQHRVKCIQCHIWCLFHHLMTNALAHDSSAYDIFSVLCFST